MRRILLLITLMVAFIVTASVQAADSDPMGSVMQQDARLSTFVELVTVAGLDGFAQGQGNYTVLAPTNEAFASMNGGDLASLKQSANDARKFVLYHTLHGRFGSAELRGKGSAESVLGPNVLIEPSATIRVNGTASLTQTDIESSNAVIHIADAVLDPDDIPQPAPPPSDDGSDNPAPAGDAGGEPQEEEKPDWYVEPQPQSGAVLGSPHDNPAYVGGGVVEYWSGVMVDSSTCKGMTWVVLRQMNGVTEVGADRQTNPYRGDSSCNNHQPLLCIDRNLQGAPSGDYAENWAYGRVQATVPVHGSRLQTKENADAICRNTFGQSYRMAEFHDGNLGSAVGSASGWKFWALGGLEPGQRFWVSINDQPANPWNSYQPPTPAKINTWVTQIEWPGQDPAFVGGHHMMPNEGIGAGRSECKGMTWVIHRQFDGLIQVGADRISNPYKGDQSCDKSFPVLCIKVQGHSSPANINGVNFNHGWSAGEVDTTYPYSGHQINTREKANAACRSTFGGGWRMAMFHDGALGTQGTDGWKFWAYGGLNEGRRFWVGINDQKANPWNMTD